jgi:general secretion pathway protein D
MNSIDNPSSSSSEGQAEHGIRDLAWLEVFASAACWIGIAGLIALITQSAWAENRVGFKPGTRPSQAPGKPSIRKPSATPDQAKGNFFDDDDDFDDDDFETPPNFAPNPNIPPPQHPSSHSGGSPGGPRTFSAGGAPAGGPDPVRTSQGIAVGGTSANGIISNAKTKIAPVRVDDETAEGSKDLVTDFNFPDADILDIAKTLGKLTGKNFILDKDVKGRITIISNSAITVGEAWKVFLTALDINGFALIPSGKYLRIARQRDARDKQLKTYTGDFSPDTDALISRVFPLKYISAEEVARTFRSFMPANSRIIPYDQTNTVIVTDTGSNIAKLAKMLEILDIEGYDAGIEVIPVKYASAAELSKLIDALIPGTGGGSPAGGAPGIPRFGGGAGGRFSARRTKEGGIINTIISDDRTNTLIVHANTRGADQVRELIAKLDQRMPPSHGGGKVHVYYLQFADAEQIANTLNNISTQSGARPSVGVGPGGTGTGVNPISQSLFEGTIKISPDKSTNALVITASPTDYLTVQRVINKLDIPRNQVYVEVAIMEVGIGRNLDFSANAYAPNAFTGSLTNPSDIGALITGSVFTGGTPQGALIGVPIGPGSTININGVQTPVPFTAFGLVKALQGNSNTNILATPQIIALDNTEAVFESSDKIPIATNTVTATGLSQQSATKEPVVLSIKIKPQINKITNFVKMDVTTKLGNIDNSNVPPQLRNISFGSTERTAQTTVVVGNSDTVVLGGLIRDRVEDSESKVPILGDIPILGWLFKAKKTVVSKNNLLIFMTPHIIRQYEKIRAILDRKLKERDDFLESAAGGVDPMREQRDNIIRSLPDIKELTQQVLPNDGTVDEERPAAVAVDPSNPGNTGDKSQKGQPVFNPEERAPMSTPPQTNPGAPQSVVEPQQNTVVVPDPVSLPPPPTVQ